MDSNGSGIGRALALGISIAVGLAVGGFLIGNGFYRARVQERYVTVRGLVERPVRADVAVWSIAYSATGDDVSKANEQIESDRKLVYAFALAHGFPASEIEPIPTRVTDRSSWGGEQIRTAGRYLVTGGIRIRSTRVEQVQQASQLTGELIRQGVVLSLESQGANANPAYFYTKLDSIRPAILAEATKSARAVADQFARDSKSRLGPIRRANQGVFEITGRDSADSRNPMTEQSSIDKTVRLVSTIQYYLEN